MRILYLVIASDDPVHIQDENTQRSTWAFKNFNEVIWLRGGEKTFFDESKQTLFVKVAEKYENILAKTILGIEWCIKNLDFDFLIRANVSTFFVPTKVHSYLAQLEENINFFGGYLDFSKNENSLKSETFFVNGGAFFLSREAALTLLRVEVDKWKGRPDDLAMSQFLINEGLKPTWIPRGNVANTGILTRKMYYRMKSSSNSNMATIRMRLLDKIIKTPNLVKKIQIYFLFTLSEIRNFRKNHVNLGQYALSLYALAQSKVSSKRLLRNFYG